MEHEGDQMAVAVLMLADEDLQRAVRTRLEQCYGFTVHTCRAPVRSVAGHARFAREWIVDAFRHVSEFMEDLAGPNGCGLRNALVLTDLYDPEHSSLETISPLEERAAPGATLAALLVLAYPEVHWAFVTPYQAPSEAIAKYHFVSLASGLAEVMKARVAGYIPLFDPAGLREEFRARVWEALSATSTDDDRARFPRRQQVAGVLDEELAYVYLSGLAAFRCGYRVWPLAAFRSAKAGVRADHERGREQGEGERFALLFEDVFLNFADRPLSFVNDPVGTGLDPEERRLSCLEFRDRLLGCLEPVTRRVLVTIGPRHTRGGREAWARNRRYLNGKPYPSCEVYKPIAGIHRLLREAGIWDRRRRRPNLAPGFSWPPDPETSLSPELPSHSAPGRVLMVTDLLLARSRRILSSCMSVEDAVHAAALAIEAKELLCNLTPTTALEALALQHEAEVLTESLFIGVQYNLDVQDRLREIEREVRAICQRFNPSGFRRSVLNARLTIAERLAKRFRDMNQVEEELACLAEARRLRFEFWVQERPWRQPLRPVLWWIAFAMTSIPKFLLTVAISVGLFSLMYYAFAQWAGKSSLANAWSCLAQSAFFTFTLQPTEEWANLFGDCRQAAAIWQCAAWQLAMAFHGAVSFLNLGLLVSHLYMIVSRR